MLRRMRTTVVRCLAVLLSTVGLVALLGGSRPGPTMTAAASSGGAAIIGWARPLPEPVVVVRGFDATTRYGAGHRGVDLAARSGAPVRSPGPGTVRFAGPVAGHGVVSVDVGGLRFTYEPVLPAVHVGAHVRTGSALGALALGHPGCRATGGAACLHWGVRDGTRYLDPLRPVVVRVRLLPLQEMTPLSATSASSSAPAMPCSACSR
jgi:murein DD-endopeptidase MepM/ murein hydrolase activator NlpD